MIRDLAIGKAVVSGVCVSACTQKRGLEKWFLKMFAKFLLDIRFRIGSGSPLQNYSGRL